MPLAKLGITVLVFLTVFASGIASAWLLINPITPDSLSTPTPANVAPVVNQEFTDKRTVTLTATSKANAPIKSGIAGRVTSTECTQGSAIESGKKLLTINERLLIALSTPIPLWRTIEIGDKGEDVAGLQTELLRLGYSLTVDGIAGPDTVSAVAKLFNQAGDKNFTTGNVPPSRILWIPAAKVMVESCAALHGSDIAVGDVLATLAGGLVKVSIQKMPANLVPGARILTIDSLSVPIGEDGVVNDPSALEQLSALSSLAHSSKIQSTSGGAKTSDAPQPVTGELALFQPISIAVIPPSAVYSVSQNRGCIASSGIGYPVTIVGSELGQTYISLSSTEEIANVDISTRTKPPCR